ncbi:MAG: Triose-phosphate Transporter [Vezdaea aestivalis]|nr:MAG: Triose-phosphate Transporter [Vezdaea aestivalis]
MDRPTEPAKARYSPPQVSADSTPSLLPIVPPIKPLPPFSASNPTSPHRDDSEHPSLHASFNTSTARSPSVDPTDSNGTNGHRRRRSSIMNTTSQHQRHASRSTPLLGGKSPIEEEYSRSPGLEEGGSENDAVSTSDDVEMDELSDDSEILDDEETGLTEIERKQRQRRKRRKMRLDGRVAKEVKTTSQERREADQNVIRNSIVNVVLIGLWYLFSLSISIYNKWMFSKEGLDFHFPLFTTCAHMLVQFTLSSIVLYFFPRFRPRHDSISNPGNIQPNDDSSDSTARPPLMTKLFYLTRVGPCGAATGLDIGLGNMSLKIITLTFYTMCKSSSLAFVLIFAFLFRLEKPSVILVLIITLMTIGVVMMVAGETKFNLLGFFLVITAAFFSGFRWALTQILLLRNPATSNPFSSIFFLAPIMFVTLLVIAIPVEHPTKLAIGIQALCADYGTAKGILILLFPGTIAFLMTSSEFALLQRTSVVTLSIAGIFKEVITIIAANVIFNDILTPINVSGLLVTIGSIAAYNYIKIGKMREEARLEAQRHSSTAGVGAEGEGLLDGDERNEETERGGQDIGEESCKIARP